MLLVVNNTLDQTRAMYLPFLIRFLRERRVSYRVVTKTADLRRVRAADVEGVIISGSPLMVTTEDVIPNLEQFLLNIMVVLRFGVPVIGICFGCQLINSLFGGRLRKLRAPFCQDARVYMHGDRQVQGRFCLSYVVNDVAPEFDTLGSAMVRRRLVPCYIKHRERPIYGCLFHPEFHSETQYVLDNFLGVCRGLRR